MGSPGFLDGGPFLAWRIGPRRRLAGQDWVISVDPGWLCRVEGAWAWIEVKLRKTLWFLHYLQKRLREPLEPAPAVRLVLMKY